MNAPTDEQKVKILEHIRYEIKSFFWEPESGARGRELEESIKMRRMAHCRTLRDFFIERKQNGGKRKDDDVLASNFGFPLCDENKLFGNEAKAKKVDKCFNKRIFHLTYSRLEMSEDQWCMDIAFPPVEAKAEEFVKHIIDLLSKNGLSAIASDPKLKALEECELKKWELLKREIEAQKTSLIRPPLQTNTSNV